MIYRIGDLSKEAILQAIKEKDLRFLQVRCHHQLPISHIYTLSYIYTHLYIITYIYTPEYTNYTNRIDTTSYQY